ncbi:glutamate racemase [Moraxella nasovis]|uniref:glutamate racemase n=1 Tax=Moraxella nasovis TaxID=2904121 RepID=UPI001F6055AF|nr:glutamate racemase [Moraxella nasovis]UNU73936.1 glutamate racemase [Moraxella nasovis]
MNNAPIGVFDSGVGGLSVFLHLRRTLPNEQFIYYADTKNIPYGDKSAEQILRLTCQAVEKLCQAGCKLIVIACNSASAHALEVLRQQFLIPIVGLVPALKPACFLTKTKQVAVLATRATLDGKLLQQVICDVAMPSNITVHKHFEPSLVPWVEAGKPIDSPVAKLLVKQVKAWADDGVDTIVLGCTHYPFFKAFLAEEIAARRLQMELVDSGEAVANRVCDLLVELSLDHQTQQMSDLIFYASHLDDKIQTTVRGLVGDGVVFVGDGFFEN